MANRQFPAYLNPFYLHYHRIRYNQASPFNLLYFTYLSIFMFRLILTSFLIKLEIIQSYLYYDSLLAITYYQFHLHDSFLYFVYSFNLVTLLFINYTLHRTSIWPFYDVFICLIVPVTIKPTSKYRNRLERFSLLLERSSQDRWWNLWLLYINQLKLTFSTTRRHIFISLSYETRKKLYLLWQLCELLSRSTMAITVLIGFLALCLFALRQIQPSLICILLASIDFALFFIITLNAFKLINYYCCFTIVIILATIYELRRLKNIFLFRRHCSTSNWLISATLRQFTEQHTRLCYFIGGFNRLFISPFYFVHITASLIFNIYSFIYLNFHTHDVYFTIAAYGTCIFQIVIPVLMAILLIRLNSLICCTAGSFYRFRSQLQIGDIFHCQAVLNSMLKSAYYFEKLNSKRKPAAMAAGIFGEITRKKLIEFGLLYFAYLKKVLKSFELKNGI